MTQKTLKELLTEAKNIGGHASAKTPWKHHGPIKSIAAIFSRGHHQTLQDIGQRRVYAEFVRLEAGFRRELTKLFAGISSNRPATNRKMKKMFRTYYTGAFTLGLTAAKGGGRRAQMSVEDKRWMETFLRKEFDYWKKFMEEARSSTKTKKFYPPQEMKNGKLVQPDPIAVPGAPDKKKLNFEHRMEMYVQAFKSMYNSARIISSPPMTVYYWETTPAEHCTHCLYLAANGPYIKDNLPSIPASGDTKCRSNCRCHLRMRQVSMTEYLRIKQKTKTREELLRGLRALK